MPHIYPKTHPNHDHEHSNEQITTQYVTTLSNTIVHSVDLQHQRSGYNRNDAYGGDAAIPTMPQTPNRTSDYSIFVPASTSKYPIKQNTIAEDMRERFMNMLTQWIKAFVYLARK